MGIQDPERIDEHKDLKADFDLFRELLDRISSEAALKTKKRPGKLTDLQRHLP